MGFHVEVNAILRSDDYDRGALKAGGVCRFAKDGSRVFFDTLPIWRAVVPELDNAITTDRFGLVRRREAPVG